MNMNQKGSVKTFSVKANISFMLNRLIEMGRDLKFKELLWILEGKKK